MGQDVQIVGGDFTTAINAGARSRLQTRLFASFSCCRPFIAAKYGRQYTAVIHVSIVPGAQLRLTVAPKGFGSENMSALRMLSPSQGRQGVIDFVLETVGRAGPNACPPVVCRRWSGRYF
ncbi:MAG: fumarate hydratase [Saccharofermentanales bacterium]